MIWKGAIIFLWIALFVAASWLPPRKWQPTAIALVGATFLAFFSWPSLLIMVFLGGSGYLLATRWPGLGIWKVAMIVLLVAAFYIYFKSGLFPAPTAAGGVLPLGMAFYVLRIIHYVSEARRNNLPRHTALEYFQYLLFFPTLAAGPVNQFASYKADLARRRWDWHNLTSGFERILYGYVKIVFLGNWLVSFLLAEWVGRMPQQFWLASYLDLLVIGLNVYLQFSGYSDIAIGISRISGFRIPENFNFPFLATNIQEFWKRWHMTVTSFFREYIFTPTTAIARNTYLGIVLSMIMVGLWHDIALRYLNWGLFHGLGIVTYSAFSNFHKKHFPPAKGKWKYLTKFAAWLLTFNFVILSFALTRADGLPGALTIWMRILSFGGL